jgi:sec-independent protein translocase protein TatA
LFLDTTLLTLKRWKYRRCFGWTLFVLQKSWENNYMILVGDEMTGSEGSLLGYRRCGALSHDRREPETAREIKLPLGISRGGKWNHVSHTYGILRPHHDLFLSQASSCRETLRLFHSITAVYYPTTISIMMKQSIVGLLVLVISLVATPLRAFAPVSRAFRSAAPKMPTTTSQTFNELPPALQRQRKSMAPVQTMGLFGLGPAEVAIILVAAAFVLGPEKLASLGKDAGKIAGELKEVPKEFQKGLSEGEIQAKSMTTKNIADAEQEKAEKEVVKEEEKEETV